MVGAAQRRVIYPRKVLVMSKRSYSIAFKDEACRLVIDKMQSVSEAAKGLGISPTVLFYWLKKRGHKMSVPRELPSESNDPKVLQARIRELEAKLQREQTKVEILKKATAYFATESNIDSTSSAGTGKNGRSQ
jgi:transposase